MEGHSMKKMIQKITLVLITMSVLMNHAAPMKRGRAKTVDQNKTNTELAVVEQSGTICLPNDVWQRIFIELADSLARDQKTWHEVRKELKKNGCVCKAIYVLLQKERENILMHLVPEAHYAAAMGDIERIFTIKFAHKPINQHDCFGLRPIHYAVYYGNKIIAKLFRAAQLNNASWFLLRGEYYVGYIDDRESVKKCAEETNQNIKDVLGHKPRNSKKNTSEELLKVVSKGNKDSVLIKLTAQHDLLDEEEIKRACEMILKKTHE
jgi:hypothetical protein